MIYFHWKSCYKKEVKNILFVTNGLTRSFKASPKTESYYIYLFFTFSISLIKKLNITKKHKNIAINTIGKSIITKKKKNLYYKLKFKNIKFISFFEDIKWVILLSLTNLNQASGKSSRTWVIEKSCKILSLICKWKNILQCLTLNLLMIGSKILKFLNGGSSLVRKWMSSNCLTFKLIRKCLVFNKISSFIHKRYGALIQKQGYFPSLKGFCF